MAHAAAERVDTTATYLRDHDMKKMMTDLSTVVKNNPGPSLLAAVGIGFLVGRALSHDRG